MKRALITSVLVLASCGGGGGSGYTVDGFLDELGDAFCDKYVECGLIPTRADCVAPIDTSDWTDVAVEDGRLVFDGGKAAACLAAFRDLECWELFNEPGLDDRIGASCDDLITPAQTEGEPCYREDECVDGTMCDIPDGCNSFDMCCMGTCVVDPAPLAQVGEACDDVAGPFCDSPGVCVDSVCAVGDAVGDPCNEQCDGELWCDAGACAAFPPAPTALEGQPCEGGAFNCAEPGVFCLGGTCRRFRELGDACDELALENMCNPFYLQCVNGTCEELPNAGDACTLDGPECMWELPCIDGVCTIPKPDGSPCTVSEECASGDCNGTCQAELTCP